jgi:hypothetical protein
MSTLKTQKNDASVEGFLNSVDDEQKRADSMDLLDMYTRLTGEKAKMWGSSIVGFGQYHYKSERSSQEGDWPLVSFSPRKQTLTLYFMDGFTAHAEHLSKLGKHKISKGCLYINSLSDVDRSVLEQMIKHSYQEMKKQYQA